MPLKSVESLWTCGQANVFQNFPDSAGSYHLLVLSVKKKIVQLFFPAFKKKG